MESKFHIESLDDGFRLYNVLYCRELYVVDWSTELLDNGRAHTQDRWLKWLKSDENEDKWQLASGPLYYAVLSALHYNRKNHPDKEQKELIQQCRAMHAQDFKDHWMITSTRVIYTPQGKDKLIHDYGSQQQQEIELDFVGPDKYIRNYSGLEQEVNALLGTNNVEEVEQVYHDLTSKKPYLGRMNNKPDRERHQSLALWDNYFIIYTNRFIDDNCRLARGVVVHPANEFYQKSTMRGALSLVGDAGNLSLADSGNVSLK
ncbi:MAG: hypothetical protein Q8R37_04270 [Nanoarchaeota archaeon]|nr:hypothetical protein [Nanoarchaeota archaeon]